MQQPTVGSAPTSFWVRLSSLLAQQERPRVAVVTRPGGTAFLERLAQHHPHVDVRAVLQDRVDDDAHLLLTAQAPLDLVVDVGALAGAVRRIRSLSFHLAVGGHYLLRTSGPAFDGAPGDRLRDFVARMRSEGGTDGPDPTPAGRDDRDLGSLARSTTVLGLDAACFLSVNHTAALLKTTDRLHDDLLARQPAYGRVLTTVPATSWTRSRPVQVIGGAPLRPPEETLTAPALSLREHEDVICAPGQVAFTESFVLSETFRESGRRRLRSPALDDLDARFARRPDLEPPAYRAGTWFHLDNEIPGHFGHAVSEQVSHLWAWEEARSRHPDLRPFLFLPPGQELAPWHRRLLGSAGIPAADLVVEHAPVRVERLVSSTAAYVIGHYAHPVLAQLYDRMGRDLAGPSPAGRGTPGSSSPARSPPAGAPTGRRSSPPSATMASSSSGPRSTRWRSRPGSCAAPTWSRGSPGAR